MDSEFTKVRVKAKLANFAEQLNSYFEEFDGATYNEKEELMGKLETIRAELIKEVDRANRSTNEEIELFNYIPALDKAYDFVNQALDPDATRGVLECIYDAISSLEYYKHYE